MHCPLTSRISEFSIVWGIVMNNLWHVHCVQTVGSLNSKKWMNTGELLTTPCPHSSSPFTVSCHLHQFKKRWKRLINHNCNILGSRVSGYPLKTKGLWFSFAQCCLFQQIFLFVPFDVKEWRIKYVFVELAVRHTDMYIHHQTHGKKIISELSIIKPYPTGKQHICKEINSFILKKKKELRWSYAFQSQCEFSCLLQWVKNGL